MCIPRPLVELREILPCHPAHCISLKEINGLSLPVAARREPLLDEIEIRVRWGTEDP